jgi:uncharacterized RDD family membrane protein YckC
VTVGTSAGFGRRFAALVYDLLLIAALLMVYTAAVVLARGGAMTRSTAGLWWYAYCTGEVTVIGCYYLINWMHSGQTLGMRAWRLRAVDDSGRSLKLTPAALRLAWGALAWAPAALGVLWLYFDPEHLALHDRLSRTRVVRLSGS